MAEKTFPYVPPELLRHLELLFPDRLLRPSALNATNVNTPAVLAGQQSVLDILRHHSQKQQNNVTA